MRARAIVAAIGLGAIVFALFFLHPHGKSGLVYRDYESYYGGGATWRYGGDPYSREIWRTERTIPGVAATRDELLPFVGPPFGLPVWAALSRLSWNASTFVWGIAMTISLFALVGASVEFGGVRSFTRVFAALVFASAFGPLTSGIALGQVAIVSCAAVALVPFALRGRRTIAKTIAASVVAALQPNIALALVARIVRGRSAVAFVGAAILTALASQLALGKYGGLAHYASVLSEHSAAERAIAIQTTVGAVARGLGASATGTAIVALCFAIVAIATVAWQCLSKRYAPDDRLWLASAALPLAWPFAHEHDFALVFVPALVVLARARGPAWYLGAFGAVMVGADWLGLAQRPSGASFEAMRAIGAGLALVAFAPGVRFDWRALAPAGVGVGVFIAGALAAAHPLGVWPDGLPIDFHVPAAYDAAATWGAQQVRAGVARYDVTNAALRALSLLGCVLVWIAASRALRRDAVRVP